MILSNAPQQEAVLSNVGEIGEFRIRNSAKAFNILSSGLYANKIRAIIRELSCNAVDSHTAAGNADTPFEVHLPTTLEPYFSIRDFGTGLNHDQVTNIYTTYFESTKTASNAFIGALGLGSKSPFSYTDNFTVTAIKDGVKGIYSAFINGEGVPSIVKMGEEETTEQSGVEIKFSVNDRFDFGKFRDEARAVYRFFKLRPVVLGGDNFEFANVDYETENIIPGVHSTGHGPSRAVMGNIAYPIEVPNAEKTLGELRNLLACGLVMEFDIGELDFQASREGLSYIPQTIDAIKRKLEALNAQLAIHIAQEAEEIVNYWDRSTYLYSKNKSQLWKSAVIKYANDTNFPLYDVTNNAYWRSSHSVDATIDQLAACNLHIRGFISDKHSRVMSQIKHSTRNVGGGWNVPKELYWDFTVQKETHFVINDTKVGALERAKHHFRTEEDRKYRENVYVLEPIDRSKPIMIEAFKGMLHNPPARMFMMASEMRQKDRVGGHGGQAKNVTILRMEKRGGSRYHRGSDDMVWRDAGKSNDFDENQKHYYIPLSGFVPKFSRLPDYATGAFLSNMLQSSKMDQFNVTIYGVRKGDLEDIKAKSNWINLEDHIYNTLSKLDDKVFNACALSTLARYDVLEYNMDTLVQGIKNDKSPAKTVLQQFVGLPKAEGYNYIKRLLELFKIEPKVNVDALAAKFTKELDMLDSRYVLIQRLDHHANEGHVSEYINLIDEVKGV